jgi:hypothetical protein
MKYASIRKCRSFRTWLFLRGTMCGRTMYRVCGWSTSRKNAALLIGGTDGDGVNTTRSFAP